MLSAWLHRLIIPLALLAGPLLAIAPALAARPPAARLVHCGEQTCLQLSGYRARSATAVRIDGRDQAVGGGRHWRLIVPLAIARQWVAPADETLTLVMQEPGDSQAHEQQVALPPGALGRRVELASLVIRAR